MSSFPPAASDQMQRDQNQKMGPKSGASELRMSLPADVKMQENQETPTDQLRKNGHEDGSGFFGKTGDSMEVERPHLGSADKAYLRKRKLDMDQAFLEASNE